jgi:hypothetical protein
VKEIINPGNSGFYIDIYFRSANQKKIKLGNFSPYPSDEGGNYLFRVDKQIEKLNDSFEEDGKYELIFSLNYFRDSDKSNKLSVKIDSLIWK